MEQHFPAGHHKSDPEKIEDVGLSNASLHVGGGVLLEVQSHAGAGLKLAKNGHTVLVPQPSDDPNDPLNWSWAKKHLILFAITFGAFTIDYVSAAPGALILIQGEEWQMSPNSVNRANTLNILLLGIGSLFIVPITSAYGRAPIVFWTAFLGIFFYLGTTLATDFDTYYAMRAVHGLLMNAAPSTALAFIQDMFFLHERARKIGLWTAGFICSPYVGPLIANFMISQTGDPRHVLWMCFGLNVLFFLVLVAVLDETWYNRTATEQPPRRNSFAHRMMRCSGIWQIKYREGYFYSLRQSILRFVLVLKKPALILTILHYFVTFAWSIGINVSASILFALPEAIGGYGFTYLQLGCFYFTPVVGVFLGEIFGHLVNDWVAIRYAKTHQGVFRPEIRLWIVYFATPFMVLGLVILGQALHRHWNVGAVIVGWGAYTFGLMIHSVIVFAYSVDSYPDYPQDAAGWVAFLRVAGGFSVGYFQQPWAERIGYNNSFGIQAAIVAASTLLTIGAHMYGRRAHKA